MIRDVAVRVIGNRAVLLVCALGLLIRAHEGLPAIAASMAAAGLVFACFVAAWLAGWLGGGDVKLAAALAMGLPPAAVPGFLVLMSLAGFLLALPYASRRRSGLAVVSPAGRSAPLLRRIAMAEKRRLLRRGPLPYGVAIGIGAILTHIWGLGG